MSGHFPPVQRLTDRSLDPDNFLEIPGIHFWAVHNAVQHSACILTGTYLLIDVVVNRLCLFRSEGSFDVETVVLQ